MGASPSVGEGRYLICILSTTHRRQEFVEWGMEIFYIGALALGAAGGASGTTASPVTAGIILIYTYSYFHQ